jgi:hypothetical protein
VDAKGGAEIAHAADALSPRAGFEHLIATDDEAYTYNKRTNYLAAVSEHQMILRALEHPGHPQATAAAWEEG